MATGKPSVVVDPRTCTRCGTCVRACPTDAITVGEATAHVLDDVCIRCGHCHAVCPSNSLTIPAHDAECSVFETFSFEAEVLPPGHADTAELVRLLASRRSVRNFTDEKVGLDVLRDLVKVGVTAPSATNSQRWTFTLVPDRPSMVALVHRVAAVFRRLNDLARRTVLRTLLRWVGKGELDGYYRHYYSFFERRLEEWENGGRDFLFRGAPAAIVVGSRPGGSHPHDDALLATQNILLAAHAMGLGTCLVGIAVAAMKRDPSIGASIGMGPSEDVHSVIAIGHPDEQYLRMPGRVTPLSRVWRTSASTSDLGR